VALTVDWDLAARLAPAAVRASGAGAAVLRRGRAGDAGPARASRAEREDLVADLRAAAPVAAEHVARITRLREPAAPVVRVVDRPGWARANVAGVRGMVALGAGGADRAGSGARAVADPTTTARAQAGAVQLAGVLGLLSGAVLGQLDPWGARGGAAGPGAAPPHGTLLLVAPNVLALERAIGATPADFRLWVTLHEQTHAQQVAAAPWLPAHLARGVLALLDEAEADGSDDDGADAMPALTSVMALLEGHADVTMDAVGPRVVPSVRALRRRFTARREGRVTGLRRVLRSVLGLDVKTAQYRDGAAFVRGVRRKVGTAGFNAVWSAPDLLPTPAEIADPDAWVRRVHG
jgi:uncharacterized protein (DUF2342 family)